MAEYTEARKRANIKYIKEKTDDIRIRAKKGTKDYFRAEAEKVGMSLTAFVLEAVYEKIERENNKID